MRKVLSFVLVLALVLGSFSMAFGLTDINDSANSEAIQVNADLGIITGFPDGSFKPDQAVNRAEFAAMITRALAIPESALAGFATTSFKDTSGYGWAVPYLAFCESKGIMLGDGYGNAMPGRTISVNEAVTMVLRAIGYTENSSELTGAWPANYVSLAKAKNLYDDVASAVNIDRANAAQVIYNALTVDMVAVAADGATAPVVGGGNMLTRGFNAENKGEQVVVYTEESNINLWKYVGAYGTVYEVKGDIVAVADVKTTFLTGEYTSSTGILDVDGVEYKLSSVTAIVSPAGASFANGDPKQPSADVPGDYDGKTITVAVTLKGKTVDELYSIALWDVTQGEGFLFEEDMLEDDNLNGHDFATDGNDDIIMNSFQLLGVNSLEDIDVDDVVYVYENAKGDITKIEVGTEVVEGKIDRISGSKYYIDGVAYYLGAANAEEPVLGDTGTAYLDYAGEIFDWDADDSAKGNFAVLVDKNESVDWNTTTYAVKLFTADGETIKPEVKKSVAGLTAAAMGIDKNTIVEYSLDKNGKVDSITKAAYEPVNGKVNGTNTLIGDKRVASNLVVFLWEGDEDYSIGDLADFDKDVEVSSAGITADGTVTGAAVAGDGGKVKAILITDDIIAGGDSVYGIVIATSKAIDADDDTVLALTVFKGGEEKYLLTDKSDLAKYGKTTTTAGLQVLKINASGVITDVTGAVKADVDDMVTNSATTVKSIDGNFIKLASGKTYELAKNPVLYVWNSSKSKFEIKTTLSSLKSKYVSLYESDEGPTELVYDYVIAW